MERVAVILAAGLGTRMKSGLPKAAHQLAGVPMLNHLLRAADSVFDRIVVVVGPDMPELTALAAAHQVVVQQERLGTAHAALQALEAFGDGQVAILYADNPLVTSGTMQALRQRLDAGDAGLVLLGMSPPDPGKYGRLICKDGYVTRIMEYADATAAERAIGFCNAGGMMAKARDLANWLSQVSNKNAKSEFYLTDIVAIARAKGTKVAAVTAPFTECMGVNSRSELAAAEAALQVRLRTAAMDNGVAMQAPETVFLSYDTILAEDVSVGPYVVFGPGVTVAAGAQIKAFSHLEGCVVREGAIIGPYARLRPGADIGRGAHVGNFVEIKAASLGEKAKANHLTYIGDAEIGERSNIGAGFITCNYDGEHKHKTKIGKNVFVGSDVAMVAPVSVGDGALIAAGSVITEDVPADSLAIARSRQVQKIKKGSK
ncbi:MAG: bifunctional UDP-N-acetylglucosamine diphosphorylase/glucosamine-1-phosphate N-acetyltransferase GlmU [Acidocella sp.]|nr:bifunctional UDP-N-acetylglucosamine diphosphorylase/glucosamine-1-phosphate N-acetyltransferase GlmU [Acidocella sp.]